MKSINPGRGPSGMYAIVAMAFVLFGLFWIGVAVIITRNMGGIGYIFPFFGIIFIFIGIASVTYHLKNAKGKDRFSIADIVDNREDGGPSDRWIKNEIAYDGSNGDSDIDSGQFNYCPYCGYKLDTAYMYCPKCGKSVDD